MVDGPGAGRDTFPEAVLGVIYEQFEKELAAWRRKDAGQPRREMVRLLLLALEREEIVSVGYREAMIARRLATMPIGPQLRELIQHALIWAWKDEEMHAIYLRGAILRLGSRSLQGPGVPAPGGRGRRRLVQLGAAARPLAAGPRGPVARRRWSSAIGTLTGQVPRDVRQYLRYGPFRDFCLFNVDAELTARLCYDRMLELAARAAGASPSLVDDLRRVRDDEDRHARIFTSWPRRSTSRTGSRRARRPTTWPRRIGEVGEDFLPRCRRPSRRPPPARRRRPGLGRRGASRPTTSGPSSAACSTMRAWRNGSRERERRLGKPIRDAARGRSSRPSCSATTARIVRS